MTHPSGKENVDAMSPRLAEAERATGLEPGEGGVRRSAAAKGAVDARGTRLTSGVHDIAAATGRRAELGSCLADDPGRVGGGRSNGAVGRF